MTILLPLIALVLAVLDFAFRRREEETVRPPGSRMVALGAVVAVGVAVASRFGPSSDAVGIDTGLVAGAALTLLASILGGTVAPIALGVAGAAALHLLPASAQPAAQLALICGSGLGVMALGRDGAFSAALVGAMCVAADYLGGKQTDAASAAVAGSILGVAATVGAFACSHLLSRFRGFHPFVVAAAVLVGALIGGSTLLLAAAVGVVAGLVVSFVLGDDDSDAVRVGLTTVIAIGVATLAFGLGRGAGMAAALIGMGLPLLASGNQRGVLALGPLLALVLYRVLREQHPDLSRALDIGQHYAMLGIALGAVLPLIPADWLRRDGLKGAAGAFLWGLLALAVPALVVVMLGSKGAVGFVVGLGLSGLCQALRGDRSLFPLALAAGLSASTIVLMGWLREAIELTRDEKVRIFAYAGGGLLVVAALLALLSRPESKPSTVEVTQ